MVYHWGWGSRNFFIGWGSKLWFKRDCWTFLWQITSHRDDHVFLNLWAPITNWVPQNNFFLISLECSLVAKFSARFIEIISHFKSDIRSCRCNNSSITQVSGLIGGSGPPGPPSPLDPPLYQRARPPVFPICKHPLYCPTSHTTSSSTLQLQLYSAILNASVDQQI